MSLSLMTFFLLPNTYWSRISPLAYSQVFSIGCAHYSDVLLLAALAIGITLLYLRGAQGSAVSLGLWLLAASWVCTAILTALQWHHDVLLGNNAILMICAFCVGLLAAWLCGTPQRLTYALAGLASVQAVYALYYQHQGTHTLLSGQIERAGGTFNLPSGVYITMALTLPLSINAAISAKRSGFMFIWMLSATALFAALVVTWYRSAILAFAIALIWMMWRVLRNKRALLPIILLMLVAGFSVVHTRMTGEVNSASAGRSVESRLILWKRGDEIFGRHWLTGVGAGALQIPIRISSPLRGQKPDVFMSEPKNLLLDWLDEMGVAGGILFVLFCIAISAVIRRDCSPVASGIGAAWLSLLVIGVFDTPFGTAQSSYGNVLVGSLLGATMLLASKPNTTPNTKSIRDEDVRLHEDANEAAT